MNTKAYENITVKNASSRRICDILEFVQSLLNENRITTRIVSAAESLDSGIDLYFRSSILADTEYDSQTFAQKLLETCTPNTILCITDEYSCEYILMRLPDCKNDVYFIIGPFTYEQMTEERILQLFEQYKFPAQLYNNIYLYYSSLPCVSSFSTFQSLIHNIGISLWNNPENFELKFVHSEKNENKQYSAVSEAPTLEAIKHIETRYECEAKLMEAVSLGQTEAALQALSHFHKLDISQRITNPLRDKQNKLIILNTLCRKSAQAGHVSPFYLDQISTKYALRIEAATSLNALDRLVEDMIRKYCILVKSHSLRSYSTPIQNVISYISVNLTEDLSLSAIAKKFALSSNYLSALFKKETKLTLTEYVNIQRIDHSVYLLNTTLLPIQTIAELSGFLDVNYYIRLFKKHKQITPKQYQKLIRGN